MNKSESIKNLAEALAKAQAEMPAVKMNSVNPFLKNKYADLGAVIETTRPILAKYNLSISQFPTSDSERIGLTSILMHTSGEWIEDTMYLPAGETKGLSVAQSAGVNISYLRRYHWQSIIGVYADEDTDGGSGKSETRQPATAKPAASRESTGKIPNSADDEMIATNGSWAVAYAAKAWNMSAGDAAVQIAKKNLGKQIKKSDFIKFVEGV